ncbi:MAG TPA: hypothetical protein VNT56_09515 [Acidimicrobiales bacterium]|nr:hypothetical protein [Acidimicrobiales bacterium]
MSPAHQTWTMFLLLPARAGRRSAGEAGEGVISTAIAVLIMALIGAAMWGVFQAVFNDAGERIQDNVEQIQ